MRKSLTAAVLVGGLVLALSPTAALAAPARPADQAPAAESYRPLHSGHDGHHDGRDDHYRCMYHCRERGGYYSGGYDRYDHGRHDSYYHGPEPYDRYGNGECWYHDRWGWHRCGYHWRYRAEAAPATP